MNCYMLAWQRGIRVRVRCPRRLAQRQVHFGLPSQRAGKLEEGQLRSAQVLLVDDQQKTHGPDQRI
jgi:hypothetical protein